jgi:hypothetical protein
MAGDGLCSHHALDLIPGLEGANRNHGSTHALGPHLGRGLSGKEQGLRDLVQQESVEAPVV